ncbi:MBL fold metallo-hydrolase [Photobacterium sp. WH77]|uniref:MBL fold metallo-hydrolase n=1 Tax=unclassified Photobacterium TaxID=2628852 RepID=UPI001EDB0A6E|nr:MULTISPECIES: MBL fold metallo-hydrolase [unclassified Photobacterium]MCG2836458.1 MBL fold metallo-hydrolase [Photobacterium sp. WH77]MCG2843915.1 MBL fold metallo-hydrolase [Photobacterium sp. WH80]
MKKTFLMAASLVALSTATLAEAAPLSTQVYNADGNSFHVNATLVYGEYDAMLVDTGFTRADAMRIAAMVLDSGKTLKTIFISQADPDYYFGAQVLKEQFPEARLITTPAVRAVIKEKMAGKLAFWTPKMGDNAPVKTLLPDAYAQTTLTVDGETIEIRDTSSELAHRPYLWIPSSKTVLGNVAVYGNVHLWMADAQTPAEQTAWAQQLEAMQALKPQTVIPGHMKAGTPMTAENITFALNYLKAFQQTVKSSDNSQQVINTMETRYPDAGLPMALSIGAKVHMGEMKW